MEEQRKRAYRWLLYHAMLQIRRIRWIGTPDWWEPLLPRTWRQIRRAGAVADWLHNLALFSALDFDGFDEDWFWREHRQMLADRPDPFVDEYALVFERIVNQPVEGG